MLTVNYEALSGLGSMYMYTHAQYILVNMDSMGQHIFHTNRSFILTRHMHSRTTSSKRSYEGESQYILRVLGTNSLFMS